ncbi:class A beta-lactamase-related serine hydrolase [Actinomadura roseirufa]|uniref:class A beta-lactamase-related serine hydrolase n=1 Tax=Actinomadura roseirufa TaxID=2094049 RepID=UPI001F5F2877|nr:class A beta-lactamase-related serine hydrolase [Actinomadura roseirufa]
MRAAWVVFDLKAGRVLVEHRARETFRSASVVKILLALDYMREHTVSAADRETLGLMLRSSDDKAATGFWRRGGQARIIERMVRRAGLRDTAPPPRDKPGFWGYTALSAADVVRTYRYLVGGAPKAHREFVLAQLRRSTPCGTDGFDQTFGIPRALKRPWAVKQGWSGFGNVPAVPCRGGGMVRAADLGIGRPVLHTTGIVGRHVVVVLTLQPVGTSFRAGSARVTSLTRQVYASAVR